MSRILEGKSICGGLAIGKIRFWRKKELSIACEKIADADAEIMRYERARKTALEQVGKLYEKALKEAGRVQARIFEAYQVMLQDEEYHASVKHMIANQSINAEYAVAATGDNFAAMFANMEDEYFKDRSIDVKDISRRLILILAGRAEDTEPAEDNAAVGNAEEVQELCIIMAEELTPSETVQFDKQLLLGLVTRNGCANSHTAILAKTMNIPALSDIHIAEKLDGKPAIVDGFAGRLIVEPDEETLAFYQKRMKEESEKNALLLQYKGKGTVNKFGRKIRLYANIGDISDLNSVLENDAEGIGLFRSEFLYMKATDHPTEEALFQVYKQVAETMKGKKVIIRTMDIGADKRADYFDLRQEENPALGYRAIRICLTREDIFRTQLRAILRTSAFGNVSIMYPMITSVWEVRKIKEIVGEIKRELEASGIVYGRFEQGIMIETPAAAIISDVLAREVDFFSIGTNDLAQYTLAVDRQNPELDIFYDPHHEAILRLIRMTVENGHRAGIPVGVCGELAADLTLTDTLMKMGVDELSVAPSQVLPVRRAIVDHGMK